MEVESQFDNLNLDPYLLPVLRQFAHFSPNPASESDEQEKPIEKNSESPPTDVACFNFLLFLYRTKTGSRAGRYGSLQNGKMIDCLVVKSRQSEMCFFECEREFSQVRFEVGDLEYT